MARYFSRREERCCRKGVWCVWLFHMRGEIAPIPSFNPEIVLAAYNKIMADINHLHSYQLLPILASTSKATKRSLWKGCYISCRINYNAYFADYYGPSRMSSSWICISRFQSSSFSLSLREIFTIAAMTMSAAPPWIGVLIALRFHIPTSFLSLVLKKRSNLRTLPKSVTVFLLLCAVYCFCSCHFFTSGRSLNQHFITY